MRKVSFFFIFITLMSCLPDENEGKRTILEDLGGLWYLDTIYHVNGKQYYTSYCDQSTELFFSQNTIFGDPCFGKSYLSSRNCYSDYPLTINFNPDCDRNLGYFFKHLDSWTGVEEIRFGIQTNSNFNADSDCSCFDLFENKITGLLDNVDNRLFYEFKSFSRERIELKWKGTWFNRQINGEKILDTLEYTLVKSKLSPSFVVESFSPDVLTEVEYESFDNRDVEGGTGFRAFGGINGGDNDGNPYLYFNGDGSYDDDPRIQLQSDRVLENGEVTISVWVKPENLQRDEQIIFSEYRNEYGPFILSTFGPYPAFQINDGFGDLFGIISDKELLLNQWNQIIITSPDLRTYTIYINGEEAVTGLLPTLYYENSSEFIFGNSEYNIFGNNDPNLSFHGGIDEFAAYDEFIQAPFAKGFYEWGILNQYNPNKLSASREYHGSGNVSDDRCIFSNCTEFNGQERGKGFYLDDIEEIEDEGSGNTISLFIYPYETNGKVHISSGTDTRFNDCEEFSKYYELYMSNGKLGFNIYSDDDCKIPQLIESKIGSHNFDLNEWNNIILKNTKDGNALYLNGQFQFFVQNTMDQCSVTFQNGISEIHEICGSDIYSGFIGLMDEQIIFRRQEFTETQIGGLIEWYRKYTRYK